MCKERCSLKGSQLLLSNLGGERQDLSLFGLVLFRKLVKRLHVLSV